jgi:hypothetical protein
MILSFSQDHSAYLFSLHLIISKYACLAISSKMNSIQYAYRLNNKGVNIFVSGNLSKAKISVRTRALRILKEATKEVGLTSCIGMHFSSKEAELPFYESTLALPGLQDTHFYIYDHGIMLTGIANGENKEMLPLCSLSTALASHNKARLLGNEKAVEKASLFYSVTVNILSASTMPDSMSTTLLTLLALNNICQIHNDQCEYIQSVDCLKAISKIMGSVDSLYSVLNDEGIKGLLLNTVLLNVPTADAQAA